MTIQLDGRPAQGRTRLNMMGRHETHASPAQQRIANLMPLGGLADAGGSKGLGVAVFVFEEDETQPGSFKITTCGYGPGGPSLAKHLARQGCVWEELGTLGQTLWKRRPGRRARRQRRSEAEGRHLTGLMSAWQCDGPRRDGLLRSADVRDGPLIAQSLRGTPEAFVEIVRRHEVAIHGYLTRRAVRVADDLLGEVWVRAFGARHREYTSHEVRPAVAVRDRTQRSASTLANWPEHRPGTT